MRDKAPIRILLVDDEPRILNEIGEFLDGCGYQVATAEDGKRALEALKTNACRIALVDFKMPGMTGLELAKAIGERHPEIVIIMMTAYGTVETAVAAMKAGVHDFLLKPMHPEQLEPKLRFIADKLRAEDEVLGLRQMVREQYRFDHLIGASDPMQRLFSLLESAAKSELPVLVYGETGTGKELAARAIHVNSPRHSNNLVAINCAAVPESLMESELFGHVKGAFTGATENRQGKIAAADSGTLFLDELSAAPEQFQTRLLRVLQEKCFAPVGSDVPRNVNVRVIAAMNTIPEEAVESGGLRKDLFYRLNVLRIDMPPLRERREDIPLLVRDIVKRATRDSDAPKISADFLDELMGWKWPGNVRQLNNVVEAALACGKGQLKLENIPQSLRQRRQVSSTTAPQTRGVVKPLRESLAAYERACIEEALSTVGGSVREAALVLGITERNLRQKLARLGIDHHEFRRHR